MVANFWASESTVERPVNLAGRRDRFSPVQVHSSPKKEQTIEKISGVKYLCFMNDWIILAESHWKLRKAVQIMNQIFADLELEQHSDKTFIGKVSQNFDFLGVEFHPDRETQPSRVTQNRLQEKLPQHFTHAARLYEQGRLKSLQAIEQYLSHGLRWSKSVGIASSTVLTTILRSLKSNAENS